MNKTKKKVYVGLSGGVDSSVSALLLKQAGYEVVGVFIRGWQPDWITCTWKEDRISAMRTAAHLDIPFITLDLEKEYYDKVVQYLLREYSLGRTPNGDMLCNREIKFGKFLDWAKRNGADYVATGHYAQVYKHGEYKMLESKDLEKDQTYFLSQLTQKQLESILFPIGHLEKSEVRKIAAKNNLPVATRKDSQGICFVGDMEMAEFLKRELNPEKGNVLNEKGEVIGEHEGAIIYTIGQRHGFKILNSSNLQNIMYVSEKNIENNTITVKEENKIHAEKDRKDFSENKNLVVVLNNFSTTQEEKSFLKNKNAELRIRYRGEKVKVRIEKVDSLDNKVTLRLENLLNFAPGQFGVLYKGEHCLGGGEL